MTYSWPIKLHWLYVVVVVVTIDVVAVICIVIIIIIVTITILLSLSLSRYYHYCYCYCYCCWFGMYVRTNSTIDCLFSINAIINLSRCTYRNCTILASTPSLSMSLISSSLNKSFIFSGGKNKWKNGVLKLVKREINKTLVKLSQIKSAKIILSQVMRTK